MTGNSIEVVRYNMNIFRVIFIIFVALPLFIVAWLIFLYQWQSYHSCENVRDIARSERSRDYLSNWVLESFGQPDSANEIPEQLVPKGLDWGQFNIDREFAGLWVELTTISLDDATKKAYFAHFRDGRAEVMLLVPEPPPSKKVTFHQAIPQVYEQASPGVWVFCEGREH